MSLRRLCLLCVAVVVLSDSPLFASGVAYLSDTTKVMLALDHIRRSIREGDANELVQAVSPQICLADENTDRDDVRNLADSVLSTGLSRQMVVSKPQHLPFGDFWDFGLEDISLEFRGDTCEVACELKLYAAPRHRGKIASERETFTFVKTGDLWLLAECQNLFDFLMNGGARWKGRDQHRFH